VARRQAAALLLQACCQLSSLVARASSARAARTRPLAATHAAVAAYEVIQANACTGTGEHSASEARRCLYFLPSRASQLCPSPKAHARASLRRNRPRAGALLRAHTLCLQRRRSAGRAWGASVPRSAQRAARGASTAGGELALARRRTRGARRGARRRQAAATGALRVALLNAAVARPSCRAIGRGAAC